MLHKDIIGLWPNVAELADDLDVLESRVTQWRTRNSIPSDFWNDIIASAKKRKIKLSHLDIMQAERGKAAWYSWPRKSSLSRVSPWGVSTTPLFLIHTGKQWKAMTSNIY